MQLDHLLCPLEFHFWHKIHQAKMMHWICLPDNSNLSMLLYATESYSSKFNSHTKTTAHTMRENTYAKNSQLQWKKSGKSLFCNRKQFMAFSSIPIPFFYIYTMESNSSSVLKHVSNPTIYIQ